MRAHYPLLSALIFLSLISCGKDSQDKDIESLLSDRQKSYESKDIEKYMSLVSPDYRQETEDKIILSEDVKKNFTNTIKMFDTISISQGERTIYRSGDEAEVVQLITVQATINESKSSFKLLEKLRVRLSGDKWLIVKESESDFFDGYVYGGIKD